MEKEERLSRIKTLHDLIKNHPYWMAFENRFLNDIRSYFCELLCLVSDSSDETNPYYVILRCITHDFNCMLRNIPYWIEDGKFDTYKGDAIMVMQTYLMNVHGLIEGRKPEDNVIAYTYLGKNIKKYQTEWDDEQKKYFAVNVIKPEDIPDVRHWCENYANLSRTSATRDWARQCLVEIERGEKLIGKHWKIID